MKLKKITTVSKQGAAYDVYTVTENDGALVCYDDPGEFGPILDGIGFNSATDKLGDPVKHFETVTQEGDCKGKLWMSMYVLHALNNAPDEFPL